MRRIARSLIAVTLLWAVGASYVAAQQLRSRQHTEIFDSDGKKVAQVRTYLFLESDWEGGPPFDNREVQMFAPVVSLEWDDPKTKGIDHPEILLIVNKERFGAMGLRFLSKDCSGTAYTEYEHALPGSVAALEWNYAVGPSPKQTLYAVKSGIPSVLTIHSEYDNWWGKCEPPEEDPEGETYPVVEMLPLVDLGEHFTPPFSMTRPREE